MNSAMIEWNASIASADSTHRRLGLLRSFQVSVNDSVLRIASVFSVGPFLYWDEIRTCQNLCWMCLVSIKLIETGSIEAIRVFW